MKRLSTLQAYPALLATALAGSALAIAPLAVHASQIAGGNIGAVGTSASPSPSRGSSTITSAPSTRGKPAGSAASAPGKAASSARKG